MLERKHKNPKRWVNEVKNVHNQWGASVLRELTNQHLAELTLPDKWLFDSKPRLLNPTVPTARMLAALKKLFPGRRNLRFFIASGANVNGHECCWKSDVVRGKIGDQASPRVEIFTGQVGYHFSVHCSATDDHAIFTSIGGVLKMQCRDLFQVLRLIWTQTDDIAIVLDPIHV